VYAHERGVIPIRIYYFTGKHVHKNLPLNRRVKNVFEYAYEYVYVNTYVCVCI